MAQLSTQEADLTMAENLDSSEYPPGHPSYDFLYRYWSQHEMEKEKENNSDQQETLAHHALMEECGKAQKPIDAIKQKSNIEDDKENFVVKIKKMLTNKTSQKPTKTKIHELRETFDEVIMDFSYFARRVSKPGL